MGTLLLILLNDEATPLDANQLAVGVGNSGDGDIVVGDIELTGDTDAFTVVDDPVSSTTLEPGQQRRIIIEAVTGTAGTYLATLRIPSSDKDGSLTVALLSQVVAPADLDPGIAVDPLSWDFGDVDKDTGSAVKVFTVSSTGTAPLVCGTVALTGAGYALSADGVTGQTLDPGTSATFTITFDPGSVGVKPGSIDVPSDAAGSPETITLTGTGTTGAPAPEPVSVSRFYLTRIASDILSIIDDAGWDGVSPYEFDSILSPDRTGPGVAWGTIVPHTGVSGQKVRLVRWISPPLAEQAVVDSPFLCYAVVYRSSSLGSNVTSALRFGILRALDDSVDWQPVLSMGSAGSSAWPLSSNPLPRRFPRGEPFSWTVSLDIEEGDRLIVELGFRAFVNGAGGARIRWGGASTDEDLASTQDAQDTSLAPWFEISAGLLVLP